MLSLVEHLKKFYNSFMLSLVEHLKKFYNLRA